MLNLVPLAAVFSSSSALFASMTNLEAEGGAGGGGGGGGGGDMQISQQQTRVAGVIENGAKRRIFFYLRQ